MKKLLLASTVALIPTVAMAADIGAQTLPAKTAAAANQCPATGTTLCSGFVGGLELGYAGTSDSTSKGVTQNTSAGLIGGDLGYQVWNTVLGPGWYFGARVTADYDGTQGSPSFLSMQTLEFGGALTGLFQGAPALSQGPVVVNPLNTQIPYLTGGVAEKQIPGTGNFATGWVTGAGVKIPLGGRWNAKIEYDYIGFNTNVVKGVTLQNEQIAKIGMDYHF